MTLVGRALIAIEAAEPADSNAYEERGNGTGRLISSKVSNNTDKPIANRPVMKPVEEKPHLETSAARIWPQNEAGGEHSVDWGSSTGPRRNEAGRGSSIEQAEARRAGLAGASPGASIDDQQRRIEEGGGTGGTGEETGALARRVPVPVIIRQPTQDDAPPAKFHIISDPGESDRIGFSRTLSLLRQSSTPYSSPYFESNSVKKNDGKIVLQRFASVRHFSNRRASLRRMATSASTSAADNWTTKEDTVPQTFLRQDSIIIRIKPGQCFSDYANIVVESPARCDPRLGTLGELRHHLRTGTKAQVKRFLRRNNWTSGHRIRSELWKELCRDNNSDAQRAVYRDIVEKLGSMHTHPAFTSAPGIVLCDHQLKESGRLCLLRLLTAVEHQRPDFTYVPVLYPLGALFLHYMNEEEAFACIMALISQSQKFLMQTDIATAASKRTMLVLMKKHVNRAYVLCKRLSGVQEDKYLVPVFDEWKSWIFRDLPFSHLVRVVDCFLFEGQKVLFRVALAILQLWSRDRSKLMQQGKSWNVRDIGNDISEYCNTIKVQPTQLLKTAFGIRNLKMAVVRRLQEKNEMVLRRSNSGMAEVALSQSTKQVIAPHHYIDTRLNSRILDHNQALQLISWIPSRYQLHTPSRLFSTDEDGTSFTRLWAKLDSWYPTIIVIRTSQGEVFGAYCSSPWDTWRHQSGMAYFGTGETFLFRFPSAVAEGEKFIWVGTKKPARVAHSEELFQAADLSTLIVGGGNGEGICIRNSLESGSSGPCHTFDSPMLTTNRDFQIEALEAFGFSSD